MLKNTLLFVSVMKVVMKDFKSSFLKSLDVYYIVKIL